ncbi:hypothetical protein O6H91_04G054400 [Diphasiastrum complanatum]|uniref:Uncharacterized protein n=1 Tax=Diphasiastrum complanatum TaxID=34168 RepID=A0ACC2DX76_DIPCM|nr:hypothetical protein O6H91_04G054400 [Diphasiastrum complanatum]
MLLHLLSSFVLRLFSVELVLLKFFQTLSDRQNLSKFEDASMLMFVIT